MIVLHLLYIILFNLIIYHAKLQFNLEIWWYKLHRREKWYDRGLIFEYCGVSKSHKTSSTNKKYFHQNRQAKYILACNSKHWQILLKTLSNEVPFFFFVFKDKLKSSHNPKIYPKPKHKLWIYLWIQHKFTIVITSNTAIFYCLKAWLHTG